MSPFPWPFSSFSLITLNRRKKIRRKIYFSPKLSSFLFPVFTSVAFQRPTWIFNDHQGFQIWQRHWHWREVTNNLPQELGPSDVHRPQVYKEDSNTCLRKHKSASWAEPRLGSGSLLFFSDQYITQLSPLSRIKSPAHYPALRPGWHQTDHVDW